MEPKTCEHCGKTHDPAAVCVSAADSPLDGLKPFDEPRYGPAPELDQSLVSTPPNDADTVDDLRRQRDAAIARIAALEAERDELRADLLAVCEKAKAAIGEHVPPSDCYATGPLTGDPISDLVRCPACVALAAIEAAETTKEARAK